MRQATYARGGVVECDGLVLGINLGYSGCAEHEWGIKGIKRAFGLPLDDLVGYEARKITKLPNHLYPGQSVTTNGSYLIYDPKLGEREMKLEGRKITWSRPTAEKIKERLERMVTTILFIGEPGKEGIMTAWDSDSFGIHGDSGQYGGIIDELSDAFLQNDIVIDGASDLCPVGFSLLIYSRIPDILKEKFRKEGQERQNPKVVT